MGDHRRIAGSGQWERLFGEGGGIMKNETNSLLKVAIIATAACLCLSFGMMLIQHAVEGIPPGDWWRHFEIHTAIGFVAAVAVVTLWAVLVR